MDQAASEAVVHWSAACWLIGYAVGCIIKLLCPPT